MVRGSRPLFLTGWITSTPAGGSAGYAGSRSHRGRDVTVPDRRHALSPEGLASVNSNLQLDDAAFRGLLNQLDQMRMLRRSPRLAQVADAAAFLASDRAAAVTCTFANVTGGMFPG